MARNGELLKSCHCGMVKKGDGDWTRSPFITGLNEVGKLLKESCPECYEKKQKRLKLYHGMTLIRECRVA